MNKFEGCHYPNCFECELDDCHMEATDIKEIKMNIVMNEGVHKKHKVPKPEKTTFYRKRRKDMLPNCDACDSCIRVTNANGSGFQRICAEQLRMIGQGVICCPHWCRKAT